MDESSTYLQSEDSVLCKRPPRIHTTSFSSQASAYSLPHNRQPSRLKSPIPHAPLSPTSVISNGSESEILAPIPQRHYTLQASESRYWLGSPTLSAASSRPVSPLSLPANATSPQQKSQRRLSHQLSFSALMDQEPRGGSHYAHATHALPSGERKVEAMGGLGKRWVRWMHKQGMKYLVIPSTVLASVWVKWIVGLGSYSGQGTPPLFGDYEAQRHWMELTLHLPFTEWYTYDLQYWGLDYPPLTAYVSWLCGVVGSWMEPSWFTLDTSRGLESPSSKTYMRSTVLAFDTLIYVPALVMFVRTWQASRSARTQELAILALILQPALLLIDFGHFQYNSVMLGLTLLALNFFATGHDLIGAVFFVFSLGFKQMALYYAPAVGSYLLGKCLYLGPVAGPRHFIRLALVTIASFLLLFLPFLPPFATPRAIFAPITRIFPFNRGLFEDKVANFWCATDVLVKWRRWATQGALVKLSAALTAAGFLPGVIGLLYGGYKMRAAERTPSTKLNAPKATQDSRKLASAPAPTLGLLPYALLTSAMSFFLFSFQVHEKTILLPLLPLSLLFSGSVSSVDSVTFELGTLVNNVAIFSMWPLLKRDGMGVQYVALTLLWNRLVGYNPFRVRPESFLQYISLVVYIACVSLHVLELLFSPPARLPDLYPVLNVLVSTPVFVLAWLWSIKRGVEVGWALGGLGPSSSSDNKESERRRSVQVSGGVVERLVEGPAFSASSIAGIGREAGMRTKSLGFAQGRRRHVHRSGSIGSVLSADRSERGPK